MVFIVALFYSTTGQALPTSSQAGNQPIVRSGEESAINQALASYATAFNKGDIKTLMAAWTADPEFVDESGKSTKGQEAIAALFKRTFEENKGVSFVIKVRSLRFIRPDVAIQDGVVSLKTADGMSEDGLYTSIWLKNDGKWLISRVQDLPNESAAPAGNAEHLKQLEWMLGDWTSEGSESAVSFNCKWNRSQSFLLIDQTIALKDQEPLTIKHIIGWDPAKQQIRSWVFDSRGGFGESMWTRKGNRWLLESEGVLADGRRGAATSTWHYIDDQNCEWDSTSREVDGKPMPDVRVKYVNKMGKK